MIKIYQRILSVVPVDNDRKDIIKLIIALRLTVFGLRLFVMLTSF